MTRSNFARILQGIFFVGLAAMPAIAHADAIAPDEASCTGKSAGDACVTNGADGHCAASKCSKLDYSDGSPPGTKVVDCLLCVTGGVADAAAAGDASASSGGDSGAASGGTDGGASTAPGSSSSSSCSLGSVPGLRTVGPWLIGALPLLVLRKRNRKGSRGQ